MPAVTIEKGLKELESGSTDVPRIYMLVTEESLLLVRVTKALLARVVPDYPDFNFQRVDCDRNSRAGACIALCEELPVMAERRLVWLRDVHDMPEKECARLAAYLPEAPPSTILFISAHRVTSGGGGVAGAATPATKGGSPGGSDNAGPEAPAAGERGTTRGGIRQLAAAATQYGLLIQAATEPRQVAADAQQGLQQALVRHGLKADLSVQGRLLERAGTSVTTLESEVAKLACFLGERTSVTDSDVDAVATRAPAARLIFALTDAIGARQVSEALVILTDLLDCDEEPLRVLGYLVSHYRTLLKMKAMATRGDSMEGIAAALRRNAYGVRKSLDTVRRFTVADLEQNIEGLLRADQAIKHGRDGRLVLEFLVVAMAGR